MKTSYLFSLIIIISILSSCSDDSDNNAEPEELTFNICDNHLQSFEEGYIIIHDDELNVSGFSRYTNGETISFENDQETPTVTLMIVDNFNDTANYTLNSFVGMSTQRTFNLCKNNFDQPIGTATAHVSFNVPSDDYVNYHFHSEGDGSTGRTGLYLPGGEYLFNEDHPYLTFVYNTIESDPWGLTVLKDLKKDSRHVVDVEQSIIKEYNNVKIPDEILASGTPGVTIEGYFSNDIYNTRSYTLLRPIFGIAANDNGILRLPDFTPYFNRVRTSYLAGIDDTKWHKTVIFGRHDRYSIPASDLRVSSKVVNSFNADLIGDPNYLEMAFRNESLKSYWLVYSRNVDFDLTSLFSLSGFDQNVSENIGQTQEMKLVSAKIYETASFVQPDFSMSRMMSNERPDEYNFLGLSF